MANGFVKGFKYLTAWLDNKVEEKADPKVQIQQAIEQAQRQHEVLRRQAATVIGNQHQLELKLDRQLARVEELQAQTRQALVLADKARADSDPSKAAEFEETASVLANQLVIAENGALDLRQLHEQSLGAAKQAQQAVEDNAASLQQKLSERTKLLGQLEQAKMQEQVSAATRSMSELSPSQTVPTLDAVRDKIEQRYSIALGEAELAANSAPGRMREVTRATANMAGHARLAEIRASLNSPSSGPGAVTAGAPADPNPVDLKEEPDTNS